MYQFYAEINRIEFRSKQNNADAMINDSLTSLCTIMDQIKTEQKEMESLLERILDSRKNSFLKFIESFFYDEED